MANEANEIGITRFNSEWRWEKWRNDWNEARETVKTYAKKRGINLSEVPILCSGEIKVRAKK